MAINTQEGVSMAIPAIPVGVSGWLLLGLPIQDWIVLGTSLLLIGNLFFLGVRVYERFFKHGK